MLLNKLIYLHMISKQFLEQIRVVAMQYPAVVGTIISGLEEEKTNGYDEDLKIKSLRQISSKNAYQAVAEMFRLWAIEVKQISSKEVAVSLTTAQYCDDIAHRDLSIELVWTGPNAGIVPMRRTDQALFELINEATEELTIVSFAVYKIPELVKALKQAITRGVRIRMIVETPEASDGKISFGIDSLGDELLRNLTIFVWPLDKRPTNEEGKYGSLHVKCAVADKKRLFISSANLTEYALTLNMEMGLLVYNEYLAYEVVEHIDSLITNKILIKII